MNVRHHREWICSKLSKPTTAKKQKSRKAEKQKSRKAEKQKSRNLAALEAGEYPFAMEALIHLSALTAGSFGLGVRTGHMVDTCAETWLTDYEP
ncbi:hypothetical protein [Pseudomonas sp. Teo4]|uniref:hypothetical protein n=1 Tax=Pseudomonas sp. Teo4 TaxID=3064528 RepID=UPI002ACB075E|nr:hypothetical protein [Pseudomonas sp. Teo4]